MSYVSSNQVIKLFSILNESKLSYTLIRNLNNELPNSLLIGKDIDILIPHYQRNDFLNLIKKYGFSKKPHPLRNQKYLYGTKPFEFFINDKNVLIDINYDLMTKSINAGEWIPLDQEIQSRIYKNLKICNVDGLEYQILGDCEEFIALLARCIFEKRGFSNIYIDRIEELKKLVDFSEINSLLELVFFKFSKTLISMVQKNKYAKIFQTYIEYREY